MLLIHCPYCEEDRPEIEFRNAGEAHIARPQNITAITDEEFENYFFIRTNPKGMHFERWRHIHGCARFFNAARDTVSDKIAMTYKMGEPRPSVGASAPAKKAAAKSTGESATAKKTRKSAGTKGKA